MPKTPDNFSKKLITWYLQNKRDLPWRDQSDPYKVWLSEVILQQTRIDQGLPYYLKFSDRFPTVHDLAEADESEVLKLWQGLGYYSRARNLHHTAKYISKERKGQFPNTYNDLIKLKGVGDYTASAIASICFRQPNAVVDGNVFRALSRVFGIETAIDSTAGKKEFKELAQALIDPSDPGTFNQALMEFGARHCKPANPLCSSCIFNDNCVALQKKLVRELPFKPKRQSIRNRYFNYLVPLTQSNSTSLNQRNKNGIWNKLFEFPLIESEGPLSMNEIKANSTFRKFSEGIEIRELYQYNDEPVIHKLSHQHLHTVFWIVGVDRINSNKVKAKEINAYPVPVLIENFISESALFSD